MGFLDEMIYDFEFKRSRTLLCNNLAIVDNVSKLIFVSNESIIVDCGKEFTAISGANLIVKELSDARMQIKGRISKVEIYANNEK